MAFDHTYHAAPQPAVSAAGPGAIRVHVYATPLLRTGLEQIFDGTHFALANPALQSASPPAAYESPAADLLIIDRNYCPHGFLDLLAELKAHNPAARAIVLADHFDVDTVALARLAGADGFCLTTCSRDVLIRSLELVMLGEVVVPSQLIVAMLESSSMRSIDYPLLPSPEHLIGALPQRPLSSRELEVLTLLKEGAPNKVIARRLDVAEATVKVHVKTILRKIGVHNRAQAAIWAAYHLALDAALE